MLGTISALLYATSLAGASPAGDALVTWDAPTRYLEGIAFRVELRIEAPSTGAAIADWLLTPGAFTVNGKPVQERKGGNILDLAPGSVLTLTYDLAPALQSSPAFDGKHFRLGFAKEYLDVPPIDVRVFQAVPEGADLLALSVAELRGHRVIMRTSQGPMEFEFYPDKAPNHVRNFLDLCHSGFYEGTLFHRVSPTFMIQGGCPETKTPNFRAWGTGSGPRRLDAEFSDVRHERGILSMARTQDPNSATSQFFVMTGRNPGLDGQYSVFGRMVSGEDVLDRIARAPGVANPDTTVRPSEPQRIERATVIRAIADKD